MERIIFHKKMWLILLIPPSLVCLFMIRVLSELDQASKERVIAIKQLIVNQEMLTKNQEHIIQQQEHIIQQQEHLVAILLSQKKD
jgi:hypothetical protein